MGIRDLAGDAFEFLRKSSSLIQEHYPERSVVIMIVNAPSWSVRVWCLHTIQGGPTESDDGANLP